MRQPGFEPGSSAFFALFRRCGTFGSAWKAEILTTILPAHKFLIKFSLINLAKYETPLTGVEPVTFSLGCCCSIQVELQGHINKFLKACYFKKPMLVKILGVLDLVAAALLFALSANLVIPDKVLIFFIVILFLKGAFILTRSIASAFDLFAAIILLSSLYFTIPKILLIIASILLLQKGFFSVVA